MNNAKNDPQDSGVPSIPAGTPVPAAAASSGKTRRWSRRVAAAVSAGALVGGGVAIGVAVTGGASAATGAATTSAAGSPARQCASLAAGLRRNGHPVASRRLAALCAHPLLRLAAVGGAHGQVTFEAKGGARTIAFERGTIGSASPTAITVTAADGTTWTWVLASNTTIRQAGHQVAASSLARGEKVFVGGQVVGGANDARLIRIRPSS